MKLLRFDNSYDFLTFDFETCNLNLVSEQIQAPWQLGWEVKSQSKISAHEDWIWWDDLNDKMSADAARLTGFDYFVYKTKAKPAKPIFDKFTNELKKPSSISVSANGWNFDIYIYGIYCKLLGLIPSYDWTNRHVDIQTLEKAKQLDYKIPQIGTDDWIFFNVRMSEIRQRGLKTNLKFLCESYDVPYDETRHHREALYDVELTRQIFEKQVKSLDIYV